MEDDLVKFDTGFLPKALFFRKAKNSTATRPQGPTVQVSPLQGHADRGAEIWSASAPFYLVMQDLGLAEPSFLLTSLLVCTGGVRQQHTPERGTGPGKGSARALSAK